MLSVDYYKISGKINNSTSFAIKYVPTNCHMTAEVLQKIKFKMFLIPLIYKKSH